MKTTEVFVEQVLIGLLVILNVGLMINPSKAGLDKVDLKEGVALVAAAYLTGIIFDRFADTVLEDIEQRMRLKLAHDALVHACKLKENPPEDLFPEHQYRMKVLQNREAFTYGNYIRTRIRLSRAMAILIPGLSVSFLIGKVAEKTQVRVEQMWEPALLGAIYGGALVAQLIRRKNPIQWSEKKTEGVLGKSPWYKIGWYKVPKTNNSAGLKEYLNGQPKLLRFSFQEPFFWMVILLTVLGFILADDAGRRLFFAVPLISILLTLLATWSWWRINKTFLVFLRDFSEYPNEKPPKG